MNRIARIATRTAAAAAGAAVFTAISLIPNAAAAWAPTMVGREVAHLRTLGYQVCEPRIGQITDQQAIADGYLAWATTPEVGGECMVEFTVGFEPEALNWVAWHESCHLATLTNIFADPERAQGADPAHTDPAFLACLDHGPAEHGGY